MGETANPQILALTGADCFLRAFESEVRRTAQASHLSQLVLRLGPGFDVEAFRRLVGEVAVANPIVRSPIRRQGLVGAPVYRFDLAAPAPGVTIEVHDSAPHASPDETTRRSSARSDLPTIASSPVASSLASSSVASSIASSPVASDGVSPSDVSDDVSSLAPLGPIPEAFYRRLNSCFDARRGKLLCFDIMPRGGANPGTDVAMTWQHMLFDGSGSEFFIEHLAACSSDASRAREIGITRGAGGASSPAVAELPAASGERGRMAQTWDRYMRAMAAKPPRSLAGPLRRVRQDLRYDEMRFEGESATCAIGLAKKMAGFLTPMLFYLAVSIRAHQAVAESRGAVPASWIVPLPVNLRPKGSQGEVFRTHVSLLWFQVTPDDTRDLAGLIEVLKAQRLAAIKGKLVEAGVAAMDFARYAPARVYSYMARRNFGGELASFFFAYTAEFAAGARSLCGAEILDGFHAPSAPASPGSALVFSLRGGGLDVVHVFQRGSVTDAEIALLRASVRRDLEGA